MSIGKSTAQEMVEAQEARTAARVRRLPPDPAPAATVCSPSDASDAPAPANSASGTVPTSPAAWPGPGGRQSAIRAVATCSISTALNPGATVAVAAGDLPTSPSHDALFILQGPTSRAQRLVAVRHGVAVGVVTLPASLPRGTSILAAEDFSRLRVSGQARPTGIVLLDIAVFSVR